MENIPSRRTRETSLRDKAIDTKVLLSLDRAERDKIMSETAQELVDALRKTNAVEFKNINDMYSALRGVQMIVRREDPERVLEATADHEPIRIDFPEGERYSNAVEWKSEMGSRGLSNAFLEGYGQINGAVTVMGFKKGSLDVQSLPDAEQRFAGLDREYVRSVKGDVHPEDVLFVSARIPIFAYPESDMTDTELDLLDAYCEFQANGKKPPSFFIQRGFLFTDNLQKQ